MTLRKKIERTVRITLLVSVLAAAAFLSATTAMRIAIRGNIVTMPDLVGRPLAGAEEILAAEGLRLRVADRIYSSLPADAVVRQSPAPGLQIKVQQNAHVVLSLGPQTVILPDLEGRSLRLARLTLLRAGLQLGEVSNVYYLPFIEPEIVLQQDPPAGSRAVSPRVGLLVTAAPPPVSYVMPPVIGLNLQQAERVLSSAGLRVARRTFISQAGAAGGTVIGQTPPAGAKIESPVSVTLGIAE